MKSAVYYLVNITTILLIAVYLLTDVQPSKWFVIFLLILAFIDNLFRMTAQTEYDRR